MRSLVCLRLHRACYVGAVCVAWLVCFVGGPAFAASTTVDPASIESLYSVLHAPNATELPRQQNTEEGFLRFVAAPPGSYFTVGSSGSKSSAPEVAAQVFVSAHIGAFARPSSRMTFETIRVSASSGQSYVKLRQTYNGIPVFGGMMTVQVDAYGGVVCVLSDVLRDTAALDNGEPSLTPSVTVTDAQAAALKWACNAFGGTNDDYSIVSDGRMVYDPIVAGLPGSISVVWKFTAMGGSATLNAEAVLVDAHSGQVVFHYSLLHDALNRRIYDGKNDWFFDSNGNISCNGELVRSEGDPAVGIADANLAYDYFGDTYGFYSRVHGRDSIDNKGMSVVGTVRFCNPYFAYECPVQNAFWSGTTEMDPIYGISTNHMYFGEGFASADDVVGHELTHGVTDYESQLIYSYQSGAINESFSDIWGEFIDLTNGRGTDTPAVRWLMGEDLPASFGVIRNMKNPPEFGDPDRVGSPYYYYGPYDNGGVHWNSGVINKLAYLLTDGDSFNGRSIIGMGIDNTAKLFYEVQTNILTEASDFNDLYNALGQASVNLGLSLDTRVNIRAAAQAVEIAPDTSAEQITSFRAIPSVDQLGRSVIALTWTNPISVFFKRVILIRSTTAFPRIPSEGMEFYRGTAEKFLDTSVVAGTEYFYTLFSELTTGFPDVRFSRAVAGTTPADFLTEAFSKTSSPANPFDLSFTQILFSPVGNPEAALGESTTGSSYYSAYNAKVTRNISEFPVPRQDERGGSYAIPLAWNQVVSIGVTAFPFFGVRYSTLFLSANGYIAFRDVNEMSVDNLTPSLATHFDIPRISFLFANLAPDVSGEMWARFLDDRIVVAFEGIPELEGITDPPARNPNTVQVEIFYSGHIRFTYLDCTVEDAIVGLSDGQGAPQDPGLLFPGVEHIAFPSDLSSLPQTVTALTLEPVPMQQVAAGEEISFVVKTSVPSGAAIRTLSAVWNGPGTSAPYDSTSSANQAPFADNRDGTGTFRWQTKLLDTGMYLVRITATSGSMVAYQDVILTVGVTEPLPVASEVVLKTDNQIEDPRRDRPVDDDNQLLVDYKYSHPEQFTSPELYAEGSTQILWFKNNALIPAFNNMRVVSPDATKPHEQWFYVVTPRTIASFYWTPIQGMSKMSPVVTILALPRIYNVVLPENIPADAVEGEPISNLPIAESPSTGILPNGEPVIVVILGKRLSNPISVKFGGVEVQSIHAVSDYRIDVVAPAHAASSVIGGVAIPEDVVVVTAAGATIATKAFTFVDSGVSISKADVNRDGRVDAVDVQLVINALLEMSKSSVNADVNLDGAVNALDLQVVINEAIGK